MSRVANGKIPRGPDAEFIRRAERALRRAGRKLRAESKRTGIPLATWPAEKPARRKGS